MSRGGGVVNILDTNVLQILLANWDSNESGYMSVDEMASIIDIGTKFKANTSIVTFDELSSTGVTKLNAAFDGCSSLESISLLNIIETSRGANNGCFYQTKLSKAIMPSIIYLGDWSFRQSQVINAFVGSACTYIGTWVFVDCPLETLVVAADIPPTLKNTNAIPSSAIIYVPDSSLEAYSSATNWTTYSNRFRGISELEADNEEFYNEISQYLN